MSCLIRVLVVVFVGFLTTAHAQTIEHVVFGLTNSWRYLQNQNLDGIGWQLPSYPDSGWSNGPGLLAFENEATIVPLIRTQLQDPRTTAPPGAAAYFRTRFTWSGSTADVTLIFSNHVDDGCVVYLNGRELYRLHLPAPPTPITYTTTAASHEATSVDVVTLSGALIRTNLVAGENVVAVQVNQQATNSSDIVFGIALTASVLDTNPPPTLRMPQERPSYGYRFTNAFGNVTFSDPVAIVTPPDETNRIFVVEQAGRIAVITNLAAPNRTVFLDIATRIRAGGEEGLLGLAFHPGYASNRLFYTFYTANATTTQGTNAPHDRLSQWRASASNPNAADSTSELILFEQRDEAGNHNAGDLHFGPDGYLYVSLGDEGGGDDQYQNSQRIDRDFFAGLLRIDVDNRPGSAAANPHPANTNNPSATVRYRIPPDNPWIGATNFNGAPVNPNNVRTEFYAVGLRNPWRFSFDGVTGDLYLGDVGQGLYEEVNLIRRGGNYGWNYREALHPGPRGNPPVGVVFDTPIVEYSHGSGTNQGNSVTGGVMYRGASLAGISNAYVFADYYGNVWALRANGTNVVPFWHLTSDFGIAGFGNDPRNGDVLTADQDQDTIKRLVEDRSVVFGSLPSTLFHTGAFTNLAELASETDPLTPNTGVTPYDLNLPFWSDNARKTRWFFRPNPGQRFTFSRTGNWLFPTGIVWVKHFDLELTNGVPSSTKRLETRLLVKNSTGVYGVTYRWGTNLNNAVLVPDEGMDEALVVNDGGILRTQIWHYPSRSECLTCHTPVAGFALGFNTAQLNREVNFGAGPTNQIEALRRAGYFNTPVTNLNLLPILAHANDESWSREWRVRSYLAVNCAQCHQPGGASGGNWDARYTNPLSAAGLIRGVLNNNGGDLSNCVVVPGDPAHSMLLSRISFRGPGQMPPLATTVLDQQSMALLNAWIAQDLPSWQSFADWQVAHFGATNAPGAAPDDDLDLDFAPNALEWLTGTDPNAAGSFHSIFAAGATRIHIPQIASRGFELQATPSLSSPGWQPLDLPGNRPLYSATNRLHTIDQPATNSARFYRVRIFEP